MAAQIVSFFQRTPRFVRGPSDWGQQEIAEFYRVESALIRAGLRVGTDRGVTDEGDPWFVFFRADDGEVVIHFARIDGEYLIAGPAYEEVARGVDFTALVRNMIARHPLVRPQDKRDNIFLHPAALLIAVVGTAFFKSGEAKAMEEGRGEPRRAVHGFGSATAALSTPPQAAATAGTAQVSANQAVTVLAAAMMALEIRVDPRDAGATSSAAIRAAAASLDFGGVRSSVLGALQGRAVAAAQSPAETAAAHQVSALLSLVALLDTLPSRHDAVMPAPVVPVAASSFSLVEAAAPTPPPEPGLAAPVEAAAQWRLDIRLNAGGLPGVEAVHLVRELAGDANYQRIAVIDVAKLPEVLADIIARGEHVYALDPTPSAPEAPVVTPVPPPVEDSANPAPGGDTPPPVEAGGGAAPVITPPVTTPPVTTPTAPAYSSYELVKQFIDYFVSHTADIEVVIVGSTIVMFDARVLYDVGQVQHLDSLTFNFDDGSTISLVGEHSALLQNDWLG